MDHGVKAITEALEAVSDAEKKIVLPRFFKTGKGEYGEGDRFIGVAVPNIRLVARNCRDVPMATVEALLASEWHECRMCALLILVERFRKGTEAEREELVTFYLQHLDRVNNWDLVDLSAPNLLGVFLLDRPRDLLYELAASGELWRQRVAMVSTLGLIRKNELTDTLRLAEFFLAGYAASVPPYMHDLMQKAVGWMLREAGKRDKEVLTAFLDAHSCEMPRTMLRYAIEKLDAVERNYYLKR